MKYLKLKIGILIIVLVSGLMGCIGFTPDWETGWTGRYEHEKRHFRALWQDMSSIHSFIDRHLFNFDETDPARY